MIVIADSSALVALSVCDVLHLLEPLFGNVRVPQAVFDEVSIANKPQAKVLQKFLADKVVSVNLPTLRIEKSNGLGKGELEAIALYKQEAADLLLIDDARAKKTAYINNVEVMGSLGVLLLAKQRGLIATIRPMLDKLSDSDIFVSDNLLERILVLAGETS
jgi:predicted nucleic acid-binding protein